MGHRAFNLACLLCPGPAESSGSPPALPGTSCAPARGHRNPRLRALPWTRPSASPCSTITLYSPRENTILQNQAQEITANLHPNPVLSWDTQFLPLFQPNNFTADYFENQAQFDLGIGYLFERGKKRQHRLQAAKDQTAVTRAQVTDNERQLTFNVCQQFVAVLLAQSTIDLAKQDLDSFQKTVDISEARYKAGDMSEGDLLKIRLQLLQFQSDLSAARSWQKCKPLPPSASSSASSPFPTIMTSMASSITSLCTPASTT